MLRWSEIRQKYRRYEVQGEGVQKKDMEGSLQKQQVKLWVDRELDTKKGWVEKYNSQS